MVTYTLQVSIGSLNQMELYPLQKSKIEILIGWRVMQFKAYFQEDWTIQSMIMFLAMCTTYPD